MIEIRTPCRLTKIGNSYYISMPVEVVRALDLQEGEYPMTATQEQLAVIFKK